MRGAVGCWIMVPRHVQWSAMGNIGEDSHWPGAGNSVKIQDKMSRGDPVCRRGVHTKGSWHGPSMPQHYCTFLHNNICINMDISR